MFVYIVFFLSSYFFWAHKLQINIARSVEIDMIKKQGMK